jgi:hypothetical protein
MIIKLRSTELLNSTLQHCPIVLSSWDPYATVVKLRAAKKSVYGTSLSEDETQSLPSLFVSNKEAVGATEVTT